MAPRVFRPVYDPDDHTGGTLPTALVPFVPSPREPVHDAPWVHPDYATVADQRELMGPGPFRDWPGPPLVMPAGLLPDGLPLDDDPLSNAMRIEGAPSRTLAEADAVLAAYWSQQNLLRADHGLPRARRVPPHGKLQDTDETIAAIALLHGRERERRGRRAG